MRADGAEIDLNEINKIQSDDESSPGLKNLRAKRSTSANKRIIISGKPPIKSPEKKGLEATGKLTSLTAIDEMSKQEMIQIIESQRREIGHLSEKVKSLEKDKDQMVDSFKMSTSVLLERLKDLEQLKAQAEQAKHLGNDKF